MIDEDIRLVKPEDDPRNKPRQQSEVVKQLEAMGFRPHGVEW